jgi:cytochrome c5
MKKLNPHFVVIGLSLLGGALVVGTSMLSAQTTQSTSVVHSIPYPQIAPPDLPEAPGKGAFSANCVICHTYRYVTTQPKFSKKVWTAEVDKMRKTYGATIADDQVPAIIDYLVAIRGS